MTGALRIRGVDAAVWAATTHAGRVAAAQTLESLRTREVVERLAERYARATTAHRAGHLFEVMHAHAFNASALRAGSSLRAVVTEWAAGGSQTAAADLQVLDGTRVLAEVQAKLYRSTTGTAYDLARDHYAGMARLVAGDKVQGVRDVLDKRLTLNPDGLRFADYADVRAHLGAVVSVDGVSSRAVTQEAAHRAADAPVRWASAQVAGSAARQVAGAGLTAAALSGFAATASAAAGARAEEVSVVQAVTSSCGAVASAALVSGAGAALGEGLRVAALAGSAPSALASGALPLAVARCAVDVAQHGVAFACGSLSAAELATRSADTLGRSTALWAFAAAGQTVLPVPVVGALAGAVVGQVAVGLMARGLALAVAEARAAGADEARVAALEAEVAEALAWSGLLAEQARALGEEHSAWAAAHVVPLLEASTLSVADGDWDGATAELAALTSVFGGQPLFRTQAEFDALMDDDAFTLVLDPNAKR